MAKKLTPENIEAAAQHLENIQSGKTPILKGNGKGPKEETYSTYTTLGTKEKQRVFPLIPPNDPRLLMQIAPFMDDTLEQFDFKDRKELAKVMYDNMAKYGGLGLAANQLGLPYRMFVMGGHPEIENGKVRCVFNPLVNDFSEESVLLKEGCLSFPFLFLPIKRPKWVSVSYTNENSEEIEETLHGMPGRIFQHENEHMNGYVFIDLVSKLKLERAEKVKEKMIKEMKRRHGAPKILH